MALLQWNRPHDQYLFGIAVLQAFTVVPPFVLRVKYPNELKYCSGKLPLAFLLASISAGTAVVGLLACLCGGMMVSNVPLRSRWWWRTGAIWWALFAAASYATFISTIVIVTSCGLGEFTSSAKLWIKISWGVVGAVLLIQMVVLICAYYSNKMRLRRLYKTDRGVGAMSLEKVRGGTFTSTFTSEGNLDLNDASQRQSHCGGEGEPTPSCGVKIQWVEAGSWVNLSVENQRDQPILVRCAFGECSNLAIHVCSGIKRGNSLWALIQPEARMFPFQLGSIEEGQRSAWTMSALIQPFSMFYDEVFHLAAEKSKFEAAHEITNADERLRRLEQLRQTEKHVDLDFPADTGSISSSREGSSDGSGSLEHCIAWRRVERTGMDPAHSSTVNTICARPQPSDPPIRLNRGALGDTLFTSSVGVAGSLQHLIPHNFREGNANGEWEHKGRASVFTCKGGWWELVSIDTTTPVGLDGLPCFLHAQLRPNQDGRRTDNVVWPCILHKAFAKAYKSYTGLQSLNFSSCWTGLSGFPSSRIQLGNLSNPTDRRLRAYLGGGERPVAHPYLRESRSNLSIDRPYSLRELKRWLEDTTRRGDTLVIAVTPSLQKLAKLQAEGRQDWGESIARYGLLPAHAYVVSGVGGGSQEGGPPEASVQLPWTLPRWQRHILGQVSTDGLRSDGEALWTAGAGALIVDTMETPPSVSARDAAIVAATPMPIPLDCFAKAFNSLHLCPYDHKFQKRDMRIRGMIRLQGRPPVHHTFHPKSNQVSPPVLQVPIRAEGETRAGNVLGPYGSALSSLCCRMRLGSSACIVELEVPQEADFLITLSTQDISVGGEKDNHRIGFHVLCPSGNPVWTTGLEELDPHSDDSLGSEKYGEEGNGYQHLFWTQFVSETQVWAQMRLPANPLPYLIIPIGEADVTDDKAGTGPDNSQGFNSSAVSGITALKPVHVVLSVQSDRGDGDLKVSRFIPELFYKAWLMAIIAERDQQEGAEEESPRSEAHLSPRPTPPWRNQDSGVEIYHFTVTWNSVGFMAVNPTTDCSFAIKVDFNGSKGYGLDTNLDRSLPKSPLQNYNPDFDETDNDLFTLHGDMEFKVFLPPRSMRFITALNLLDSQDAQWQYNITFLMAQRTAPQRRAPLTVLQDPILLRPNGVPVQVDGHNIEPPIVA